MPDRTSFLNSLTECLPPLPPRSDLGEKGINSLEIISDGQEMKPLIGQLWRAVEATAIEGDYMGRPTPPLRVCEGWDALKIGSVFWLLTQLPVWSWATLLGNQPLTQA